MYIKYIPLKCMVNMSCILLRTMPVFFNFPNLVLARFSYVGGWQVWMTCNCIYMWKSGKFFHTYCKPVFNFKNCMLFEKVTINVPLSYLYLLWWLVLGDQTCGKNHWTEINRKSICNMLFYSLHLFNNQFGPIQVFQVWTKMFFFLLFYHWELYLAIDRWTFGC